MVKFMIWEDKDWRDVFPVKDKVESLIETVPEWFVHLRRDERFRCKTCYDPAAGDSDQVYCAECWGTSYRIIPQIIPARMEAGLSTLEGDVQSGPGVFSMRYDILHTIRSTYIERGDIVFQVGWNIESKQVPTNPSRNPVELIRAFRVDEVVRPFQRELAWLQCNLTALNDDIKNFRTNLYRLADIEVITV